MNGGALNSKAVTYGVLAVVAIAAVYFLGKKLLSAGAQAAGAVGNAVNPVNPNNIFYSGVNAVGASTSGDSSWTLGGWIYDLVHGAYDPNAAVPDVNTPNTGNATVSNPVAPMPAVLPYSYKQSIIDVPALLGTDALLTPSAYGGSSGAWGESGVPGVGNSSTQQWSNTMIARGPLTLQ